MVYSTNRKWVQWHEKPFLHKLSAYFLFFMHLYRWVICDRLQFWNPFSQMVSNSRRTNDRIEMNLYTNFYFRLKVETVSQQIQWAMDFIIQDKLIKTEICLTHCIFFRLGYSHLRVVCQLKKYAHQILYSFWTCVGIVLSKENGLPNYINKSWRLLDKIGSLEMSSPSSTKPTYGLQDIQYSKHFILYHRPFFSLNIWNK